MSLYNISFYSSYQSSQITCTTSREHQPSQRAFACTFLLARAVAAGALMVYQPLPLLSSNCTTTLTRDSSVFSLTISQSVGRERFTSHKFIKLSPPAHFLSMKFITTIIYTYFHFSFSHLRIFICWCSALFFRIN